MSDVARYVITVGDERIAFEGPAGLTEEQITDLAAGQLKAAKPGESFDHPVYGGSITEPSEPQAVEDPTLGQRFESGLENVRSGFTGLAQGLAEAGDEGASFIQDSYNATLGRILPEMSGGDVPTFQNAAEQLGEGDPTMRSVGRIAGETFLTKGAGGPIRQGVATGLLESDRENAFDTVKDAAVGGIGGKVADVAFKGARYLAAPVVDDAARLLHDAGVKLMPGQVIPALKEFEDKAMSWPVIGPKIIAGRRQSFEGFNRAALDETLKPVFGKGLPPTVKTGHQAVKYAGDKLSDEYESLIPKLTFQGDAQLKTEIADLGRKNLNGAEMAPSTRAQFEAKVRDGVMSRFKGATGTGEQYRAADRYITRQVARYGASNNPEDQAMAEAFRELQGSLSSALHRSNPGHAEKLDAINRGWSLLVPAESAAANAKGGIFSADQYRTAVRQNNRQVRKRGMARGEARGQGLAEAGSEVLPSSYPNPSGTAGHEGYNLGNMRFWQGLAASPLYGQGTQNFLSGIALSPRPAFARPVANFLENVPAAPLGSVEALDILGRIEPTR